VRDWRFWLPLICLFTGARIGEIAQLQIDDIQTENNIHFVTIKNDPKKGQATKSGQSRIAPLHSKLMAIGFPTYLAAQRKRASINGDQRLFPELEKNNRDQMGKASRFWRTYLKKIGIKDGGDGLGAHSFRHGLADELRRAGHFDRDIGVVLGHSQKTVTSGYGQLRQGTVQNLSNIIEDVRFEGVKFDHLME
jgi:integrase